MRAQYGHLKGLRRLSFTRAKPAEKLIDSNVLNQSHFNTTEHVDILQLRQRCTSNGYLHESTWLPNDHHRSIRTSLYKALHLTDHPMLQFLSPLFLVLSVTFSTVVTANTRPSPNGTTPFPTFPLAAPLSHPTCSTTLQRHVDEKLHLLHRLDRKTGTWDKSHPRWRLLDALWSFTSQYNAHLASTQRLRNLYKNLSKPHRKLLEATTSYTKKLNANDHLAHVNRNLETAIVQHALAFYALEPSELEQWIIAAEKEGRKPDQVSVSQATKHFVRDWSAEGSLERAEAFECVLGLLDGLFPVTQPHTPNLPKRTRAYQSETTSTTPRPLTILVPGAGLGRLAHEIDSLGDFEITLNEWSSYMLLTYRYLTSLSIPHSVSFHPFFDSWSHHAKTADMHRGVKFPDITPTSTNPFSLAARAPPGTRWEGGGEPSPPLMIEGDFTTAFTGRGLEEGFDSVVTLFFIDTARNLISYFETIHTLLQPDGYWVNFGPLLYGTAPFVQLSMEEIVHLVEGMGFEFVEMADVLGGEGRAERLCGVRTESRGGESGKVRRKGASYAFNGRALNLNRYWAQGFVVRKVR